MSSRRLSTYELLYAVTPYLTERDRDIVRALARFRVFTAEQLAEMYFDTLKRGQVRLRRLYELGVLDRFQPYRAGWGSSPYHYVLGPLGAEVVVAEGGGGSRRGTRPSAMNLALGRPRDLVHIRTINGFYSSLLGHARWHPETRLVDWMTAGEAAKWSDRIVQPGAFFEWAEGGRMVEYFVELDRGGRTMDLAEKVDGYGRFESLRGQRAIVLMVYRTRARERFARQHLGGCTVAVATASGTEALRPDAALWDMGDGTRRRLGELHSLVGLNSTW